MLFASLTLLPGQVVTVRGRVEVEGGSHNERRTAPSTVIWLTPVPDSTPEVLRAQPDPAANLRLVQKNKSFEPHILVVPVGAVVEFPNRDPFFHNVFSYFDGKRFDLGLYEAGSSRMVHFDRVGISYIFCNIHPEMSAVVITLSTPLYAISNASGQIAIEKVPFGRYVLHIWSENTAPESALTTSRDITISEHAQSLGVITVPAARGQPLAHKNKYGRNYDPPTPDNPAYPQH